MYQIKVALVFVYILGQVLTAAATKIFYISPDYLVTATSPRCPSQPCATLSQYLLDNNGTLPVVSNVEYQFLPGKHHVPTNTVLRNLYNCTLAGVTPLAALVTGNLNQSVLLLVDCYNLTIINLVFDVDEVFYRLKNIARYIDDAAILLVHTCTSCHFENIIFLQFGLTAYNLIGKSSLKNVSINVSREMHVHVGKDLHHGLALKYEKESRASDISIVEMNYLYITGKGAEGVKISLNQDYNLLITLKNSQFYDLDQQILMVNANSKKPAQLQIENCFLLENILMVNINQFYYPFLLNFPMVHIVIITDHLKLNFTNCTFQQNHYWKTLVKVNNKIMNCLQSSTITITGCNYIENNSPLLYFDSDSTTQCMVMLRLLGPILITDNSVYTSSEFALLHIRKTTVSIQGLLSIDENFVLNNYIVLLESCDALFSQRIKITQNICGKNIIMI